MDKFKEKYHVRYVNFRFDRFEDRIVNEVQLSRLCESEDIEVLYIKNLDKVKGEKK